MEAVMPAGSRILVNDHARTVCVARVLVTGGATAAVAFILCWVATLLPFGGPTHAYISLFTDAGLGSTRALVDGTIWSLVFGALFGALLALIYNAAAPLDPRKGAIHDEVGNAGRTSPDLGE
jgi:hypothetical protein